MERMTPSQKVTQSLERVQQWLHTLDWKDWLRQILPDGDRDENSSPPPSQRNGEPDGERRSMRSLSGPTDEELARLERGSLPSILEVADEVGELTQATAREEEHPVPTEHELDGSRSAIGQELAQRMLREATGDEGR